MGRSHRAVVAAIAVCLVVLPATPAWAEASFSGLEIFFLLVGFPLLLALAIVVATLVSTLVVHRVVRFWLRRAFADAERRGAAGADKLARLLTTRAPDDALQAGALDALHRVVDIRRFAEVVARMPLPPHRESKAVETAIDLLTAADRPEAVGPLPRLFWRAASSDQRRIVEVLCRMGGREGAAGLLDLLQYRLGFLEVADDVVPVVAALVESGNTPGLNEALRLLIHCEHVGLALQAIRGLGVLGSEEDRGALVAITRSKSRPEAIRKAAEQAIEAIHARVTVRKGRLSLAGGKGKGRLGFSDEAGRLSLAAGADGEVDRDRT